MSTFIVENDDMRNGGEDTMRISANNIECSVMIIQYTDKDTKQIVCSIPSLDITGYGENAEKALEMLHEAMKDYLTYLNGLTIKNKHRELVQAGFHRKTLSNKQFSKAYVDVDGQLKGFNVEDVKVLNLQAA